MLWWRYFQVLLVLCTTTKYSVQNINFAFRYSCVLWGSIQQSRIWILQYTRCHIHKLWWWYCQVLVCTTKYSAQNMNFAFRPAFRPAGTLVYYDKVFRVQNMNFAPPSLVGESRWEASIISTLSLNQYVHIDTTFSRYYFFLGKYNE